MQTTRTEERIEISNLLSDAVAANREEEIRRGLTAAQKTVPSRYFYDARGSRLFERICDLPEYYQTRTELSILRAAAGELTEDFREGDIIELGSGANIKIRTILDAAFSRGPADLRYIPVDVSEAALVEASKELVDLYPSLRVSGVVADFTRQLAEIPAERRSKLVLFFGGTIGNFDGTQRSRLLKNIGGLMRPDDRFLLGIDMIKQKEVLERAYNDRTGITAEFNRNILRVLNRELDADFEADRFSHLAFYNEDKERIEMHLVADRRMSVAIRRAGLRIELREGETIRTEICGKFSRKSAEAMADEAGLTVTRWFSDRRGWFSVIELGT
jgi:L-histidine N-alpha-methyltransferase